MNWVYLSPHLDDVVLSCGGLLWEQVHSISSSERSSVAIWTVCAGDPPSAPFSPFAESLHLRWDVGRDATQARRREDAASCALLDAQFHHYPIPDCIYRRSPKSGEVLYASEEAIFEPPHPDETGLVEELARTLARKLHSMHLPKQLRLAHNELGQTNLKSHTNLVSPLTLGGHIDHRLVRAAAELLDRPLWYYADFPYSVENAEEIPRNLPDGWELEVFPISEDGMQSWVDSVAAHRSQINTFWPDMDVMAAAIREYAQDHGGVRLWRPPQDAG